MAEESIAGQYLNSDHTIPFAGACDRERANYEVALGYARAGIPVFPCDDRKRPRASRGHHDATTDLAIIGRWWRRWPDALVGIPTGSAAGIWVLDVDGEAGRTSFKALLTSLEIEGLGDLSPIVVRTPSRGLHLYFHLESGERPRNRARDIGDGLDTRGVKADGTSAGYVIAPGSMLLDGRRYEPIDPITLELRNLPADPFAKVLPAPRKLLYLATFNAAERAFIAGSRRLSDAIQQSGPSRWSAILDRHRLAQRAEFPTPATVGLEHGVDMRQRTYARAVLQRELQALSAMPPNSGRNDRLFRFVCRIGRWVHAGILTRAELTEGVLDACERNGLSSDDGRKAVLDTIASGLAKSANDVLPVLEDRL